MAASHFFHLKRCFDSINYCVSSYKNYIKRPALLPTMAQAQTTAKPERWIVTNSYMADIVVALGGAPLIVAVGGGSDHIAELKNVPRLPGFRQTSAEPMLSVSPQRVLVTSEWAVPQTLDQLRAAGVAVEMLDGEQTPAGVERRIRSVAKLMGKEAQGEQLVMRFKQELAAKNRDTR